MASTPSYTTYTAASSQPWQQPPAASNPESQGWPVEPTTQPTATANIPAFYTSAQAAEAPPAANSWQTRSGWQKNIPSVPPIDLLSGKNLIGLVWDHTEKVANPEKAGDETVYSSVAVYQNTRFVGTGRTKKDAMNDAAKNLLKGIGESVGPYTEEKPATSSAIPQLYQLLQSKKWDVKLDFNFTVDGPPFEASITLGGQTFSAFGTTKKVAKASVARRALDAISTDQLIPPAVTNQPAAAEAPKEGAMTPIGKLHSRLGSASALVWEMESVKSNIGNTYIHTATVTYEGRRFIAQDTTKKGAKNNAALEIFKAAASGLITIPELPKKAVKRPAETDAAGDADEGPAVKQKKASVDTANHFARVTALFPTRTQWNYVRSGPDHQPQYQACATLEGQTFNGVGGSKKEGRSNACESILAAVEAGTLIPPPPKVKAPVPAPMEVDSQKVKVKLPKVSLKSEPMDQDSTVSAATPDANDNAITKVTRAVGSIPFEFDRQGSPHDPSFLCTAKLYDRVFSGSAGSKKDAKLQCCQTIMAALESGEIEVVKKLTPQVTPQGKVAQLWPDAVWEYTNGGPPNNQTYTASITIDGRLFIAEAPAKKTSKMYCCVKILEAITNGLLKEPERTPSVKSSWDVKRFNAMFGSPPISMETGGTLDNPEFTAKTTIEGRLWSEKGASTAEATSSLIKKINEALSSGEMEIPLMVKFFRTFKRTRIVSEMTGTEAQKEFTASFRYFGQAFNATSVISAEEAERELARKSIENFSKMKEVANAPDEQRTPLAILNERTANEITMDVQKVEENLVFKFIAKATVQGQVYQGSGRSKPQAKQSCAAVILSEVYGHHFDIGTFKQPQTADDMLRGDIGALDHQALSNKVQTMVFSQYADAVASLDAKYHGRKVLAGCVVTIGDNLESAQVIAVAAGTKCIQGGNMSHNGRVVNDMHAEILVRRAMKKYLIKQIELTQSGQQSILASTDGGKYKLSNGVRFHLFITSPPCGDSRIFVSSTSKEGEQLPDGALATDPNPDRHNRGQLRAKMETGQGTVPVKAPEYNKVQSWDGIMAGDRYLNMSCCDKVARWTLLGIQGSLLSTLMEPAYFSSIIIASMFHQGHIYRGVYGRIKDLKTLGPVAEPFKHQCLEIIGTVMPELRNTIKPPNHAVVWQSLTNTSEVLETKNGLLINSEISSLCKTVLFAEFRKVARGTQIPDTYEDAKKTASQYQTLKKKLYAALETAGLGKWIGKPIEQDQFTLDPAAAPTPAAPAPAAPTPATAPAALGTPSADPSSTPTRTSARTRKGILKS